MLDTRIREYRNPMPAQPVQQSPPKTYQRAVRKAPERKPMNPMVKQEILEMFNDVWYDFDEENGQVDMEKYKQVMKYVKKHKKLKYKIDDPFSDENLEKAFIFEDETKYRDEDIVDGMIGHKSVVYILHDILERDKNLKADKFRRKIELNQ